MPVPQRVNFLVEQASCLLLTLMPVPQRVNFLVEQASCLLLTLVPLGEFVVTRRLKSLLYKQNPLQAD